MTGTILEVALNGPWSRDLQPGMPITVEELIADGIACAQEGAAVIHLHVYDPGTGRQYENFDAYRAVIEGIRSIEDVIVYPTLPLSGSPDAPDPMAPEDRFATMEALAREGLIEWAVIDPGSTQFTRYSKISTQDIGFTYLNPEQDIRYGLDVAAECGVHPSYAIYEPGFARLGAALADQRPTLPKPIYRLMFSDGFTFGFPPRAYAVDAYLDLLADIAPQACWMVAGLHVDVLPLVPLCLEKGGHIRVGLEDAPFGTELCNRGWTAAARKAIEANSGYLLDAPAIRAALRTS